LKVLARLDFCQKEKKKEFLFLMFML